MKPIQLSGNTYGLTVPEGSKNFEIIARFTIPHLFYHSPKPIYITLDEGHWTIVGIAKDMSEDQWGEIVEGYGINNGWKNYEASSQYMEVLYKTRTESGLSLVRSKGMKPETTLIIQKQ